MEINFTNKYLLQLLKWLSLIIVVAHAILFYLRLKVSNRKYYTHLPFSLVIDDLDKMTSGKLIGKLTEFCPFVA